MKGRPGRLKMKRTMLQDKLTKKFQEALAEAQSQALAHDNQFIEPVHLLAAVLADGEGSSKSLLERAGVSAVQLASRFSGRMAGSHSTTSRVRPSK